MAARKSSGRRKYGKAALKRVESAMQNEAAKRDSRVIDSARLLGSWLTTLLLAAWLASARRQRRALAPRVHLLLAAAQRGCACRSARATDDRRSRSEDELRCTGLPSALGSARKMIPPLTNSAALERETALQTATSMPPAMSKLIARSILFAAPFPSYKFAV